MYFGCFCSSLKQCAAVELHTSVHLPRVILAECVVLLHPGNDNYLGEQCSEFGSFSLSFTKVRIMKNNYRYICGEEETLNDVLAFILSFFITLFPAI